MMAIMTRPSHGHSWVGVREGWRKRRERGKWGRVERKEGVCSVMADVCVSVGQMSTSDAFHLVDWGSFSLAWNLSTRIGWLDRKRTYLHLLSSEITSMNQHALFLMCTRDRTSVLRTAQQSLYLINDLPSSDVSSCTDTNIWTVPHLEVFISSKWVLRHLFPNTLRRLGFNMDLSSHTKRKKQKTTKIFKVTTRLKYNKIQLETGWRHEQSRYFLCKKAVEKCST